MHSYFWALLALIGVFLTGCGGGGGDSPTSPSTGGSPPVAVTPYNLGFSPATLSAELSQGRTRTWTVRASLSRVPTEKFNAVVVLPPNVFQTNVTLTTSGEQALDASFTSSSELAPGSYKGQIEVRLCTDDPTICRTPLPGSPFFVPYDVTVLPPIRGEMTPLSFSGIQGDAAGVRLFLFHDASANIAALQVTDLSGHFREPVIKARASDGSLTPLNELALQPRPDRGAGDYEGLLAVRACRDLVCQQFLPGPALELPFPIGHRRKVVPPGGVKWWAVSTQADSACGGSGLAPVSRPPSPDPQDL
jgi:hypothetical protein